MCHRHGLGGFAQHSGDGWHSLMKQCCSYSALPQLGSLKEQEMNAAAAAAAAEQARLVADATAKQQALQVGS